MSKEHCSTCKWWQGRDTPSAYHHYVCDRIVLEEHDDADSELAYLYSHANLADLYTHPMFSCFLWEPVAEIGG